MYRPRIIPVLLLNKNHLVKSIRFKDYRYIGDPINAVKIFNDLRADELVFLDIAATKEKRTISLDFVKEVGEEANMPFAVGGGINKLEDIKKIIAVGAEKVVLGSVAITNPEFVAQAADAFGSSTIAICIDVKTNIWGKEKIWIKNGSESHSFALEEFAKKMQALGAGEIIIQSIERDGTQTGYDLSLIKRVSKAVTIPVVALGGAGEHQHLKQAYEESYANGLAAGSIFVYQGKRNGVLVNYPEKEEIKKLFHT